MTRAQAVTAIAFLGAVAVLIPAALVLKEPAVERWHIWRLGSEDAAVMCQSIQKLGEMRSARAVPFLLEIVKKSDSGGDLRGLAEEALARIGPPAIPRCMELLKDEDGRRSSLASEIFLRLGPTAAPALLKEMKKEGDAARSLRIARLLIGMRMGPEATVPALLEILKRGDPGEEERRSIISVLEKIGPSAGAAVPDLMDILLQEPSELTRYYAFRCLGAMGKAAVPPLVELLKSPEASARRSAAHILGDLGGTAREAVPALQKLESDPGEAARSAAAEAIEKIGKAAP